MVKIQLQKRKLFTKYLDFFNYFWNKIRSVFLGYPFFNHCFFFANTILKRKCLVSPSCKAEQLLVIIKTEVGGAPLADFMRKTEEPGKAYCIWCNQDITHGSRGKVALTDHAKTLAHQRYLKFKKLTTFCQVC